jgi:hypothetical protein
VLLLVLLILFAPNRLNSLVRRGGDGRSAGGVQQGDGESGGEATGRAKGPGRSQAGSAPADGRSGQDNQRAGTDDNSKQQSDPNQPGAPDSTPADEGLLKREAENEQPKPPKPEIVIRPLPERPAESFLGSGQKKGEGRKGGDANDRQSTSGSFAPGFSDRLAVTPVGSDDIGQVLRQLGTGYDQFTDIGIDALGDERAIKAFSVIFINCGGLPTADNVNPTLRNFVDRGGTIYASCYQFPAVAYAFPESMPKSQRIFNPQRVRASVVDKGLINLLGKTVELDFNTTWMPADFYGKTVTTYLKGKIRERKEPIPLLVRFPFGEGSVIFTAFHNSAQNSETEQILLKYLVFSAVTAALDSKVANTLGTRGLVRDQSNLLNTTASTRTFNGKYDCKKKGPLEFVLAFEDLGARLKLKVRGPNGDEFQKQGTSTLSIAVDEAVQGEWLYEVTALEVPFANFPFTVTVATKK